MSFYEFLTASKKRHTKRFSDLTIAELNQEEKELRLENKMIGNSESDVVLNFLKALHEAAQGLDFLVDNPNLCKAIFFQKTRFNKTERIIVKKYKKIDVKYFFSNFLQADLENAIGEAITQSNYSRLVHIAKFNQYLPEEVLWILKSNLLNKLKLIEMRIEGGVFGVYKELEEIQLILAFLGDQNLIRKKEAIQKMAMLSSLKEASQPGIVSFFNEIGNFFDALSTEPKTVIEKEKKRETIRGCGWVFMVVSIIVLCSFLFLKIVLFETDKETRIKKYPMNYKNSDQFPAYLTDFKRKDITTYQYIGPIGKLERPLDSQFGFYPEEVLLRGPNIINNSSYDLIIFSTENIFPMDDSPVAAATYIKSGSSSHTGTYYLNRMYFGDSLSLFNTKNDQKKSTTNRFIIQPEFSRKCIEYRIRFKGRSSITILDSLDRIFIDGTGNIELYKDEIVSGEKLPLLFPPKS